MDLRKEINKVVDPAEFKTHKAAGGEKKRARHRLHQMNIEIEGLERHINSKVVDLARLNKKLQDKCEGYYPEAEKLIALLKHVEDVKTVKP